MVKRGAWHFSLFVFSASLACSQPPLVWEEDTTAPLGAIDSSIPSQPLNLPSAVCSGSARLDRTGGTLNVVWWSPRPDSSVRLEFARSNDDGAHWLVHASVDTTDVGVTGCRRTPASVAADLKSGYVHVSYALVGKEGAGLFFAHSMDNGASFHSPVPIVYGERLGYTGVSASGDNVVVAFEDPNSATPRIGLAVSRTMGHIFEHRLLPVSDVNGSATQPAVLVQGQRVSVTWREGRATSNQTMLRVRSGILR